MHSVNHKLTILREVLEAPFDSRTGMFGDTLQSTLLLVLMQTLCRGIYTKLSTMSAPASVYSRYL